MDYISARSEHGTARQCMNFQAALIYVFISHWLVAKKETRKKETLESKHDLDLSYSDGPFPGTFFFY